MSRHMCVVFIARLRRATIDRSYTRCYRVCIDFLNGGLTFHVSSQRPHLIAYLVISLTSKLLQYYQFFCKILRNLVSG